MCLVSIVNPAQRSRVTDTRDQGEKAGATLRIHP